MVGRFIGCCILVGLVLSASAQDKITLSGNRVQEGTVLKVDADKIILQLPAGQFSLQRKDIVSIEIKTTPQIDEALKATETKKYKEAIPVLKAATDKYMNLSVPWLMQAYDVLGESYIGINQWPTAVETFKKLLAYYPESPYALKAKVGLGRALVNEKKYDEAMTLLEEATAPLRKELLVTADENAFLGSAMVALGDCYAAKGEWDKALNSYLSTVVLYWRDEDAVREAQKKAEEMKEKLKASA